MKKMKFLITALFALFMFAGFADAQSKDKSKDKKEECVVFDVNMHCTSCKAKIEKNIAFEKGVKALDVSLENKTVAVTYRADKNSEESLKQAFEKLGYTATVKKEEEKK